MLDADVVISAVGGLVPVKRSRSFQLICFVIQLIAAVYARFIANVKAVRQ